MSSGDKPTASDQERFWARVWNVSFHPLCRRPVGVHRDLTAFGLSRLLWDDAPRRSWAVDFGPEPMAPEGTIPKVCQGPGAGDPYEP